MCADARTSRRYSGVVLLGLMTVLSMGCRGSFLQPCVSSSESRAVSPDGNWLAEVTTLDCGATTASAKWVTLSEASSWWPWPRRWILAIAEGARNPTVSWKSTGSLQVQLPAEAEIFRVARHCREITIVVEGSPGVAFGADVAVEECERAR